MICQARSWIDATTSRPKPRSAFTLIEMVVVVMLLAIIAGAVLFSLDAPLRKARLERVLDSIEDADRRARLEARRSSEAVELTIDDSKGTATQSVSFANRRSEDRRALPFSGGLHIDRFITAGRDSGSDRFAVSFAPDGRSETYAVRLNANRNDQASQKSWLVVVGATGQYIRSNEDSVVESIVSMQP